MKPVDWDALDYDQKRQILGANDVRRLLEAKGITRTRTEAKPLLDDGTATGRHWAHVRFGRIEPACDVCREIHPPEAFPEPEPDPESAEEATT